MGGKGSKACPEVGNIIEAMVFDNEGKSQGFVILEIRRLFGPGEHGRFILGDYVTASDSFYRFWMESDGSMSRVDGYYHLCRGNAPECDVKPRGGDEVVHLGKWRTLKEEELNPTVLPHFTGEARGELARFHKQATPPSPEGGGGGLPWSTKKPAGLKIRKDKPGEGARDIRKKPAGLPEDEVEADDTSTTGLRKQLEALKKRLADKEAEEDAEKARKKRRTDRERKEQMVPYPALKWMWKECLSFRWKKDSHINELEAHALIAHLKRVTRSEVGTAARLIFVVDSQVIFFAVSKGRSPSTRLNRILRKLMALQLASDTYLFPLWTISAWNWADIPSRR